MEFPFNVNALLPEDVSKINSKLQINGSRSLINSGEKCAQILNIIDELGSASAKAQGLHVQVTTGEKLLSSDHSLYVMKEQKKNSTEGVVVGILKMGRKKLFLLDHTGAQNEMLPLCVLDFYIHESKQRMGYGKKLFDHMLQDENVFPNMLAIDRPSSKFLAFLRKHYSLVKNIPQVNNFIIFEGFFRDRQAHRRKSIESCHPQLNYDSYGHSMINGSKVLPPLLDARVKKQTRASYPFYNENKKSSSWRDTDNQENVQGLNAQTKIYSRHRTSPVDSLGTSSASRSPTAGLLQWQDDAAQDILLGRRQSTKLTPDKSCSSLGTLSSEDSALKIFGVPSAWMQTSRH